MLRVFRSLPPHLQHNLTNQKGQGAEQGDSVGQDGARGTEAEAPEASTATEERSGSPKASTASPPPGSSSPSPCNGPVSGEDMKEEDIKEEEEGEQPEKEETKEEEKTVTLLEVDFGKKEIKEEKMEVDFGKKEIKDEELEGALSSPSSGFSSTSLSNNGAKEEKKSSSGHKRPTSEDGHSVERDGKRPRIDGVELEAQLELKITAKAGGHHKLEKIVQEMVEKRLRGLQLTAFDLSLKELKDRVEKYDKHQSTVNTLQAKISRLVERIAEANQSSEDNSEQEISLMAAREEETARLLSSNAVLPAGSGEQWNQLIDDYFLAPRPESQAEVNESDSDGETAHPAGPELSDNANATHEDTERDGGEPLFLTDPTSDLLRSVQDEYASVAGDIDKVCEFKCGCKRKQGKACYTLFTPEEILKKRDRVQAMTPGEKHMFLLGKISSTMSTKKKCPKVRQYQRTSYFMDGQQICRETFKFLHVISQDRLTAIIKFYKQYGVAPMGKTGGGGLVLHEDVARIVRFISNLADDCALPLPGRLPGFKRVDIRGLPTSETKSSVWRKYKASVRETGHQVVDNHAFQEIWRKLLPNIVIGKPTTDLCAQCQQNNLAICRSSNLPERVKSAKLRKQEEHLRLVGKEQEVYREMTDSCKAVVEDLSAELGPNPPCSRDVTVHYSFNFAQQIHYPSDPLQPGPVHFLVPRKCGVFGVCCEGIPQQVNYLIDEAHRSSGGADAVVSYLHHFFHRYGLGERHLQLHCHDSVLCSGQNEKQHLLWYCAWRCAVGLHDTISLNVLAAGHATAIGADWCFGLLKQKLGRTPVSCLRDICRAVRESAAGGVNIPQLVGSESGESLVPSYDWQTFLAPGYRALPGVKRFHHLGFTRLKPGVVLAKEFQHSPEEEFELLRPDVKIRREGPGRLEKPGLDAKRQWYLFDKVRDFCTEETKDVTCPRPSVPRPGM